MGQSQIPLIVYIAFVKIFVGFQQSWSMNNLIALDE